ncbi:MAG: NTP transferase domain-containing protein [Candidatus Eisenbacteria bacterium]|nr:NTP transferase domain-containing protein [Candidatus Eisenbacteria bacterium]
MLILAGGRGERFWPWSRPGRPKQLLPLGSGARTLLRATYDRACRVVEPGRILVMTAVELRDACAREAPGARVLGEPVMRNTAPAIAAAAAWLKDDDAFAVMPADHAIDDESAFARDLERAFDLAERERVLMTFGIRPGGPETNFGYIHRGAALGPGLHRVARFTEKPGRDLAAAWLASGEYAWNSGIFVWRRGVFFDALAAGRPAIAAALRDFTFSPRTPEGFGRALESVLAPLESVSVDYAVLESALNTLVLDASFDWDDLGSWSAWARRQGHDQLGNVLFGDAIAIDCERCVVVGDGGTAAAMGLHDMVVVHANGATLSCRLEDSDQVRRVSEAARARESS